MSRSSEANSRSSCERPTKAAALQYRPEQANAPVLLAKGTHLLAQRIIEIAKQQDIPILQNKSLVDLLMNVPIQSEIPASLYEAVAEVLAYIYQIHGSRTSAKGTQ